MSEQVAQILPMLVMAGLTAGWLAEVISRAGGYGFVPDLGLVIGGSMAAGGLVWLLIAGEGGMLGADYMDRRIEQAKRAAAGVDAGHRRQADNGQRLHDAPRQKARRANERYNHGWGRGEPRRRRRSRARSVDARPTYPPGAFRG